MTEQVNSPMLAGPTDPDVRQEIIETVRRFVANEVIPVASELEHHDRFPTDIVRQMRDLGLFGVTIPEEYGGLGLDLLTYIGVIEELAYGWMSLTGIVNTHTMAATLIMTHGNDEQRAALAARPGRPGTAGGRSRSPSPTQAATPAISPVAPRATATNT